MDMITIQTDADGRMLCPECGGPLSVHATVLFSGIPVFLKEDDNGARIEFDTGAATHWRCETAMQYCEECGWNGANAKGWTPNLYHARQTSPEATPAVPPVEDTALQHFISAVQARFIALRSEYTEKFIRYEDDITTVALAVAEVLEPEGFNVEPTQWCATKHPRVREDEEAHFIPTQDILNWMGADLCREVVNRFANIGIRPLRFLPVPRGVLCCVGQYDGREDE